VTAAILWSRRSFHGHESTVGTPVMKLVDEWRWIIRKANADLPPFPYFDGVTFERKIMESRAPESARLIPITAIPNGTV
jgi:hypothetical protein